MSIWIFILILATILVVAIVAVAIGFAEGYRFGHWVALQTDLQNESKTPDYERGYRDALADYSRSLINRN